MLKYDDIYESDHKDTCDIFEEQRAYVIALGLTNACAQIGK